MPETGKPDANASGSFFWFFAKLPLRSGGKTPPQNHILDRGCAPRPEALVSP